ncbi:hypothetical protein ACVWWV_003675 [Bacillus sp. TE9122W]
MKNLKNVLLAVSAAAVITVLTNAYLYQEQIQVAVKAIT